MGTQARGAVVAEAGADFEIRDVTIDDPGPNEVLVKIVATGLCHTDLAVKDGDLPTNFPAVLGHEGAGEVLAVGDAVQGIAKGDKVVLSYGSCGHCRPCQEGLFTDGANEAACRSPSNCSPSEYQTAEPSPTSDRFRSNWPV